MGFSQDFPQESCHDIYITYIHIVLKNNKWNFKISMNVCDVYVTTDRVFKLGNFETKCYELTKKLYLGLWASDTKN